MLRADLRHNQPKINRYSDTAGHELLALSATISRGVEVIPYRIRPSYHRSWQSIDTIILYTVRKRCRLYWWNSLIRHKGICYYAFLSFFLILSHSSSVCLSFNVSTNQYKMFADMFGCLEVNITIFQHLALVFGKHMTWKIKTLFINLMFTYLQRQMEV